MLRGLPATDRGPSGNRHAGAATGPLGSGPTHPGTGAVPRRGGSEAANAATGAAAHPAGSGSAEPDAGPGARTQRGRILAAATDLIATHGVEGMTMRQLAAACGLNIATLYHYFASKSDLLGAIVDERHYDAGLRDLALPVDPALPPRARLEAFVHRMATQALGELRLWRLLVGESLRDDAVALAEARRLSGALHQTVDRLLDELFPELDADPAAPDREAATSVVTGQLVAIFLEEMLFGDEGRAERVQQRAAAIAAVAFPTPP